MVASTQIVLKTISVAQMQIADLSDLSVETIRDSPGQSVCRDAPRHTECLKYKPEFRFRPIACAVYASRVLSTTQYRRPSHLAVLSVRIFIYRVENHCPCIRLGC